MKIVVSSENIVDVESDAMIYSTNTRLALTGGVGAALVSKFGSEIQTRLINSSNGFGMELAEIGDVISAKTNVMPWKLLIHTVVTDGSYIATPKIIESVIEKSLNLCVADGNIREVTMSELGTGYGSLSSEQFNQILLGVAENGIFQGIEKITICKFGFGRQ